MLEINELPRDPIEALKVSLNYGNRATKGATGSYNSLQLKNHIIAQNLTITFAVIKKCAARISDTDLKNLVLLSVELDEKTTLELIRHRFDVALTAIIAYQLDDHFLEEADVQAFDYAELNEDDKSEIRKLMRNARDCVNDAQSLLEWQKKNILHHIAKIENELLKSKSKFEAFLAAGYETSELVKKIGEDAQPIADAIRKALTITSRTVEGQMQIEKEAEPKQLPKPDASKE